MTEEKHTLKQKSCLNGHEFEQVKSLEVKCKKCPVGYILPPGSEVKNGHIYIHGQQVI